MDEAGVQQQLSEVRALLLKEPGNAGYAALERTLREALELLRGDDESEEEEEAEAPAAQRAEAGAAGGGPAAAAADAAPPAAEVPAAAAAAAAAAASGAAPSGAAGAARAAAAGPLKRALDEPSLAADKKARGGVSSDARVEDMALGARCEAFDDGLAVWQCATLESYTDDSSGKCSVRTLHDNQVKALVAAYVRPIRQSRPAYDRTRLMIGVKCEAKFSGDGQWYPAVVMQLTRNGCVVRYEQYRSQEEVAFENIDPELDGVVAAGRSQVVAEVPKHLQVSEEDSEQVKQRKGAVLSKLRKEANKAHKEIVLEEKKSGWQAFQAKQAKKR